MGWSDLGVLMLGLCCAAPVVRGQGYVNIAPGKTYNQSSTYVNNPSYLASNAADGNTATDPYFRSNYEYGPFWEVDLGRKYPVQNINVWGRRSINDNLTPFNITVDGQHCGTVNSTQISIRNISVTCSSLLYGQRVRLTRIVTGPTYLVLCEFEILVPSGNSRCDEGRWGPECQYYCDNNCGGRAGANFCYQSTLNCYDECVAGRWGDGCQNRCGQNCVTGNCDLETGHCSACIAGWYGEQCNKACPSHSCLLNTCHQTTGRCLACYTGYDGDTCTACGQGFSKNNTASCSPCSAFCNTGGCDAITGNCTNACTPGWYGDQCTTRCPSHSCLLNTCHQKTGRCLACHTGYDGENCTEAQGETPTQKAVYESDTDKLIVPVVGSIVGVGLLLTISLTAAVCWINRRREHSKFTDKEDNYYSTPDPVLMLSNTERGLPELPSSSPSSGNREHTEPKTMHTDITDDDYTHPKTIHTGNTGNTGNEYTHPNTIHTGNTGNECTHPKTIHTGNTGNECTHPKTIHTGNTGNDYTHPKTIHAGNTGNDYTHPKTIHTGNTGNDYTHPKTIHTGNTDDDYTHPKTIHTGNTDDDYTRLLAVQTINTDEKNTQINTVRTESPDRQGTQPKTSCTQDAGKQGTEDTDEDHIYSSMDTVETTF